MFEQVIGQQEAKERLLQLVEEQRLPHALMLCGPMGSGKMALAMAFAAYLLKANSQRPTANIEAMLAKWEHPDLHFTYPTIKLPSMSADHKPVSDDFAREWHELIMAGPYFTMNEWLEMMGGENQQAIITAGESDALIRKLSLKSSQGGYKVSLIWLPERMNIECANSRPSSFWYAKNLRSYWRPFAVVCNAWTSSALPTRISAKHSSVGEDSARRTPSVSPAWLTAVG